MYESLRIVLGCKIISKRCLFCDTSWISQREHRSLSTNNVEMANEGHGEHRASREARGGAHWGGEGGKLYPDRIGGEMVARGASSLRG